MRPSRHQMFMGMARSAATRSTCFRLNVGAVVVESRNVVAIGYNGAPSGQPHCGGNGCQHFTRAGCKVVHAEVNALDRVDTSPTQRGDTLCAVIRRVDLYCTHSPCSDCTAVIRLSRARGLYVDRVFFEVAYRDPSPIARLVEHGVGVFQVMPSGLMIDHSTGNLVE